VIHEHLIGLRIESGESRTRRIECCSQLDEFRGEHVPICSLMASHGGGLIVVLRPGFYDAEETK
jgi:hypothetical protein